MTRTRSTLGLGMMLALALLARPVAAYGPSQAASHTLQAFTFTGFSAADDARFAADSFGSRFCSGSSCVFEAAVLLPSGALVTDIELEACDTDPAASVGAQLLTQDPLEAGLFQLGGVSTGAAETPGCVRVSAPTFSETVDNFSNTYQVEVVIDGATSATRFQAVRLYYVLQVNPPPPVASFFDVPTSHPFFQWIEALVAAGITTGCSVFPPRFCPDDPVTRAQMAVFLAKALGLQFAP